MNFKGNYRISTPHEALDVIAHLIYYEASLEEQDAWLKAVIELGFVEIEE